MCGLLSDLLRFLFLGCAVAVAAIYISKSVMLESMRQVVDRKFRWVGYALKCAFCMIGWISLFYLIFYTPVFLKHLFSGARPESFGAGIFQWVDFVTGWLVLWAVGTLYYRVVWPFLFKNAPKMRVRW